MMKSFRHSADERNSSKVLKLRMKLGAAGYGVYLMILERLAAENDLRATLDYDVLAYDFHVEAEFVRQVVEDFDLFEIDIEAETFSHEGLMEQKPAKFKREVKEKQLDKFIERQAKDEYLLDNLEGNFNMPRVQIKGIMHSSFRDEILSNYTRIPPAETLINLLYNHLESLRE